MMKFKLLVQFLEDDFLDRYSRQIAIIGIDGQKLLKNSTVLVIGAGGIGSPLLTYLTAAGVGKLVLVDKDTVELTNLHRQILFREEDVGFSKAIIAKERLKQINSEVIIESYAVNFDLELALKLIPLADLIIDGSDNYETRYLINDICVLNKKTFISCSVLNQIIQLALFNTNQNCYRCIYPKAPSAGMIPNCEESGIVGAVAGIAGTLTANLAMQYLLNLQEQSASVLRIFDAHSNTFDSLSLIPKPDCTICGVVKLNNSELEFDVSKYGLLLEDIDRKDYLLVDIREPYERAIKKLDDDLFFPIKNNRDFEFFLNYKEKKILLYCASANRSKAFVSELRAKGVEAFYLKNSI